MSTILHLFGGLIPRKEIISLSGKGVLEMNVDSVGGVQATAWEVLEPGICGMSMDFVAPNGGPLGLWSFPAIGETVQMVARP